MFIQRTVANFEDTDGCKITSFTMQAGIYRGQGKEDPMKMGYVRKAFEHIPRKLSQAGTRAGRADPAGTGLSAQYKRTLCLAGRCKT